MKLTLGDIQKITVGALSVTEQEDGFHFIRCTEKQTAAWYKRSDFLGNGSTCSTGIRLDFHTTSKTVEFSASKGRKFDLYIDDLFRSRYTMNDYRDKGERAVIYLTDCLGNEKKEGDETRVTLYLPSHEAGIIDYIAIDDGATLNPHKFDMKMLFIGDSITQGWNSRYDSLAYAQKVAKFFNAESINQGIGGSFFNEDAFEHIDFDPDVTVVAYGTNDWGYRNTLDELRSHAAAHLKLIKDAFGTSGKKIFVISPIWRETGNQRKMGSFEECRAVVAECADSLGLIHIDGLSLVPPNPEFFADQTLHPNDLGFSLYAENLIKQMLKYL